MRLKKLLVVMMLFAPVITQATVADEIAALERLKAKQGPQLPDLGIPGSQRAQVHVNRPPSMVQLADGRQVNINNYAVVVFMQRGCQYSAKFDPKLKTWADEMGIKVYPYSLDGYGDASFPVALIPRKAGPNEPIAGEILTFFGNGLPIATPTTFMVNVNTNTAYPLYQGDTDMATMSQRLSQMIEADIDHLPPDTLGPVPSSGSVTPQ